MKKFLTFISVLLMGGFAQTQSTQTYTGTIEDLSGAVIASGQVMFSPAPSIDSTIPGAGRFVPTTITCKISDGTLSADGRACAVTANVSLSRLGTSYRICEQPNFASPGSCFYDYALGGTRDISTIAPTLSAGSINYGGVSGPPTTPAASQTLMQSSDTTRNTTRSVLRYGAKCDGVTDDTAKFQLAATAAGVAYALGGGVQTVTSPAGVCVVNGVVNLSSGTHWLGVGTILVKVQTGHTFYAVNADDVALDHVNITVQTPAAPSPDGSAIAWYAVNDNSTHHGFYVRHCNVKNSSWGIFAVYNNGTGSLHDVDIADNTVSSDTVYTNGDGIHVAGRISGITIHDNRVYNRNDAGVALTSEYAGTTIYVLSGAKVSNNVLLEDLVGLDNGGATNTEWSGNYVKATTPTTVSPQNPAYRQTYYVRTYPTRAHVFNNYLCSGNNSGASPTVKIDPINSGQTSWPSLDSSFEKNIIDGPNAPLYIRGKGLTVGDNTFVTGGTFSVDYDGSADRVATANITVGTNKWMAAGSINFGLNCSLYSNIRLQPQSASGTLTYINLGCVKK